MDAMEEGGVAIKKFACDTTVMVSWTSNISVWTFGIVFFCFLFSIVFACQGLVLKRNTSSRTKLGSLY